MKKSKRAKYKGAKFIKGRTGFLIALPILVGIWFAGTLINSSYSKFLLIAEAVRPPLSSGDIRYTQRILSRLEPILGSPIVLTQQGESQSLYSNLPNDLKRPAFSYKVEIPISFSTTPAPVPSFTLTTYFEYLSIGAILLFSSVFSVLLYRFFKRENLKVSRIHELKLLNDKRRLEFALLAEKVAHDIQSPVSALQMLGPDLHGLNEQLAKLLGFSIERIQAIASELLNYSRTSSKEKLETPAQMTSNQIFNLLNQILAEKRIEFSDQNIEFRLNNFISAGERSITCDPDNLARILSNFINNSIEAMDEMEKQVQVLLELKDSKLILSVIDNGTGFTPSVISKIGKARVSSKVHTSSKSGTGIGLFDAKEKAEKWGARFHFENLKPKGAKVSITFDLLV